MAIQYDKLNEAMNELSTIRTQFTLGNLTTEELAQAEFKIKNEIRVLLGLPPVPPAA